MFGSTVLSYLDRQSITLVKPYIADEFHLTNAGFGWVLAAFSLSYAFFQLPAGYLADRLDVRWVYALAVGWWSLAAIAMAFSPVLGLLMVFRALLGLGESFNWPCALRVTSMILPPADRSLGNGIFNSGAAVGAVLAPLLFPPLALRFGWRSSFVIVGSLGILWMIAWVVMVGGRRGRGLGGSVDSGARVVDSVRRPWPVEVWVTFGLVAGVSLAVAATFLWFGERSIWCSIACFMIGLLVACRVLPESSRRGLGWAESLGEIVRLRRFWVLVLVSISINVCWHFLINWLPTYLKDDRGMSYLASGYWSALPFLAADLGNLGGGAASRWLVRGGLSPSSARTRVMLLCSFLIGPGALVGQVGSDALVIALLVAMAFGTAAFMANYFAFCQEVSDQQTGLVVGVLGGLGNLFVAGFLPFAGSVKDATGSFGVIFIIVGILPFVGLVVLWLGWGEDAQLSPVSRDC